MTNIFKTTRAIVLVLALPVVAFLLARWLAPPDRDEVLGVLTDQPGCSVEMEQSYPFPDWPWPMSLVSFDEVFALTLTTDVFAAHVADVRTLRSLQQLTLTGGEVTDQVVRDLASLRHCESLGFIQIQDAQLSCSSLEPLAELTELGSLLLTDCRIAAPVDLLIGSLESLEGVNDLNLYGTKLDAANLSPLARMPDLESLMLAKTGIDDTTVDSLLEIKSLSYLDVSQTAISEIGVQRLAELPALECLEAMGIPIKVDLLGKIVEAHPNMSIVSEQLPTVQEVRNLYEVGKQAAEQAAKTHDPADFARGVDAFTKVIALHPGQEFFAARGMLLEDEGQLAAAEADFTKVIELDADGHQGWSLRAGVRLTLGNFHEAVDDATRALASKPDDAVSLACRGRAWLGLGQPQKAIEDFDSALQASSNPDALYSLFWRAQACLALQDWDAAIRGFTAALERETEIELAYAGRAIAYEHVGQSELAVADRAEAQRLGEKSKQAGSPAPSGPSGSGAAGGPSGSAAPGEPTGSAASAASSPFD